MLPRLHVGDVAVSRPLRGRAPAVGSVLLFDDPDYPGRLRLHRFTRVDDAGLLVTRGDANREEDSSPITLSAVHGVATLRVPWVALPVVWVRERRWAPLGAAVAALAVLTLLVGRGRRFGFPDPPPGDQQPPHPEEPSDESSDDPPSTAAVGTGGWATEHSEVAGGGRGRAGSRRVAVRATAAAGAVLLAVATATPAGAVFSSTTGSRADLRGRRRTSGAPAR